MKKNIQIIAVLLILVGLSGCTPKSGSSNSGAVLSPSPTPSPTVESTFKLIEIPDDVQSMHRASSYESFDDFFAEDKIWSDSLDLIPAKGKNGKEIIIETGHRLYHSQTEKILYIMSGKRPIKVISGNPQRTDFLREEGTGKRILCFATQEELDDYKRRKQKAQDILAGKESGEEGTIILDGAVSKFRFIRKEDGRIYIPLKDVAKEFSPNSYYDTSVDSMRIYVNDYYMVTVPTDEVFYSHREQMRTDGEQFLFKSWHGERFETLIPVLTENQLMPAEDVTRVLGWTLSTNDKTLNIVTDEINCTDNLIVYNYGVTTVTGELPVG